MRLVVKEVLGTELAISEEDGQKVFNRLKSLLQNNNKVELDFEGMESFCTSFMNAAIGQLLGDFTPEFLRSHISFLGTSGDLVALLKAIVDNAKKWHGHPSG